MLLHLVLEGMLPLLSLPLRGLALADITNTLNALYDYFKAPVTAALGLVILAGGYLWMAHNGETSRVNLGKKLIFSGVIGAFLVWFGPTLAKDLLGTNGSGGGVFR